MSFEVGLVLYVMAAGFVAAGLLNALHQSIGVSGRADASPFMILRFDTPLAIAWSAIVCVFAGPYLVIRNGYQFWRLNVLPTSALLVCGVLSAIWSFCSGVLIIETAIALSLL